MSNYEEERKMKKFSLAILAFVLVVSGLVGCSPAATPTTAKPTAAPTAQPTAVPPTAVPTAVPKPQPTAFEYPVPGAGEALVDTAKYKKDGPYTIAYVNASTANAFRITSVAALLWEASKYPDEIKEILHTNANNDNAKQVADMEDMVTKGVDAIIVAAVNSQGICPGVQAAYDAGIPVIVLERYVTCATDDVWTSFIDVNVAEISRQTAEWFAQQLNYEGKVVLMKSVPGQELTEVHARTVKEVFAKYPGIELLAEDYAAVSRAKGKEFMEAWLRAFPQIDGVISWTGTEAQGAIEAAQEAGRLDQIKVWMAKTEQGYLQQVKGGLQGGAYYAWADLTIEALHAALNILHGNPVPKVWRLPVILITPENIDDFADMTAPITYHPSRVPRDEQAKWLDLAAKQ
jgi:ribose transport system substrate-binding protein